MIDQPKNRHLIRLYLVEKLPYSFRSLFHEWIITKEDDLRLEMIWNGKYFNILQYRYSQVPIYPFLCIDKVQGKWISLSEKRLTVNKWQHFYGIFLWIRYGNLIFSQIFRNNFFNMNYFLILLQKENKAHAKYYVKNMNFHE